MSACTVPRTVLRTRSLMASRSGAVGALPFPFLKASACWSMAVLKNMAVMMGAGPLMVMDTLVFGEHRSKPA